MLLVSYYQSYSSGFRYDWAGNNDFFQVLHIRWLRYIANRRAEGVRGSFSESYWHFENKYQRNWRKVFVFDGLFGWYKSKTNFIKPSIISSFKSSSLFLNEANALCTIEFLLWNVSKKRFSENQLNVPVKSQPVKA